jgi:hypothetical protein
VRDQSINVVTSRQNGCYRLRRNGPVKLKIETLFAKVSEILLRLGGSISWWAANSRGGCPRFVNAPLGKADARDNPSSTATLHALPSVLAYVGTALLVRTLETSFQLALFELRAHPRQGVQEVMCTALGRDDRRCISAWTVGCRRRRVLIQILRCCKWSPVRR